MSQAGIDNEDLSVNLKKRVDVGRERTKSLFSLACICKVPEDLGKLNRSAYTPRVIAIGPLHHENEHLKGLTPLRDVKAYYTHRLLSRVKEDETAVADLLQKCADQMKQNVQKAKEYYAADLQAMGVSDEKMSEMMLFDGCFIIELLYASYLKKLKKQRGKEMTAKGGDSGNAKALCSNPQPNRVEDMSKGSASSQKKEVDPILDIKLTNSMVKLDLLLLENQIPFFVLEDLFKLTVDRILGGHVDGCTCKSSLTNCVVSYFHHVLHPEDKIGDEKATATCSCSVRDTVVCIYNTMTCYSEKGEQEEKEHKEQDYEPDGGYVHILHLLHQNYRLGQRGRLKPDGKSHYNELPRPASELDDAGVKFVTGTTNNSSDVKFTEPHNKIAWWFHRAKFEIPTLYIHDSTEPFLRNLIAYEQCCPEVPRFVSSYAKLMDMLINTEKDVEVLKKARVIHHYLGKDGDVSDLFNGLCKEIVIGDHFFFNDECQKAYTYSQQLWPKCIAYWKRTYFGSPWAFRGVLVAIIIFGMLVTNFVRTLLK